MCRGILAEALASTVTSVKIIVLVVVTMIAWPLVVILFGIHVVSAWRGAVDKQERDRRDMLDDW